jgi:hypothetical protein
MLQQAHSQQEIRYSVFREEIVESALWQFHQQFGNVQGHYAQELLHLLPAARSSQGIEKNPPPNRLVDFYTPLTFVSKFFLQTINERYATKYIMIFSLAYQM